MPTLAIRSPLIAFAALAALAGATLYSAVAQAAGYSAQANVGANAAAVLRDPALHVVQDQPDLLSQTTHSAQPLTLNLSANATALNIAVGNGIGSAFARAEVAPGRISIVASASGTGSFTAAGPVLMSAAGGAGATAGAGFEDWLTFDITGVAPATPLLLDLSLRLHGNIGFTQNLVGAGRNGGSIAYNFDAQLTHGGAGNGFHIPFLEAYQRISDGIITADAGWLGVYDLRQTLVFAGVPARLTMRAAVGAQAGGEVDCFGGCAVASVGGVFALGDLGNTLSWEGISRVTLADGTPLALSALSVVSASGFDYVLSAAPVPEPPAVAMALAGCLAAIGWTRRRGLAAGEAPGPLL